MNEDILENKIEEKVESEISCFFYIFIAILAVFKIVPSLLIFFSEF